jgi:hypothetical protein
MTPTKKVEDLSELYFSASEPSSFRGPKALYEAAKKHKIPVTLRQVKEWLSRYDSYTLHKPIRYKHPRLRTVSYGFMDLVQADLADMSKLSRFNGGAKFILFVVCVLSKKIFLEPLKKKTSAVTAEGFQKVFERMPVKPSRLQTDMGGEFWGKETRKLFKDLGISHFSSESRSVKASLAEVGIREVKRKIYRSMTHRKSKRYVDILEELENGHNSRIHPSTGFAPNDVSFRNSNKVFEKLYPEIYNGERRYPLKYHFEVGDKVRITMKRDPFRHGFYGNWSSEKFTVVDRLPRDPPVYRLAGEDGSVIRGLFYRNEMTKVLPL